VALLMTAVVTEALPLLSLEHWNEDEIKKRAEILSEQVIKVWAYPQVSDDVLRRYKEKDKTRGKEYTLADHPHLTGPMLVLFNQFRKRVLNLDSFVTEEILKLYIPEFHAVFTHYTL